MPRERKTKTRSKEIYDGEGVLQNIEIEKIFNVPVSTESFSFMFHDYLGPLLGIKHMSDRILLDELVKLAEFNTGEVILSTKLKNEICEKININKSNFSKNMKRLKDLNIISGDKGTYLISPKMFWKGEKKLRDEILKRDGMRVIIEFRSEE